jgi:hypothetical protein
MPAKLDQPRAAMVNEIALSSPHARLRNSFTEKLEVFGLSLSKGVMGTVSKLLLVLGAVCIYALTREQANPVPII